MADGLLPGLPKSDVAGPGAAGAAHVGVVTAPAVAPQVVDACDRACSAAARRAPRCPAASASRMLPPLQAPVGSDGQPLIVPSASMPSVSCPAGTSRHVAVGQRAAQHRLVRAEVADVVARATCARRARRSARAARASIGNSSSSSYGCSSTSGSSAARPIGDGQLDLPGVRAARADQLEHVGQLGHRQPVDLRVDRDRNAGRAQVADRRERARDTSPCTPRSRSCVARGRRARRSRCAARPASRRRARSASMPRPPVVIVQRMPAAIGSRARSRASRRAGTPRRRSPSPRARRARPSGAPDRGTPRSTARRAARGRRASRSAGRRDRTPA